MPFVWKYIGPFVIMGTVPKPKRNPRNNAFVPAVTSTVGCDIHRQQVRAESKVTVTRSLRPIRARCHRHLCPTLCNQIPKMDN